jgi:hypothetical protein
MLKIGALLTGICSVLLGVVVLARLFLRRELSGFETTVAIGAAVVLGTCWWLRMLRHMRSKGYSV